MLLEGLLTQARKFEY